MFLWKTFLRRQWPTCNYVRPSELFSLEQTSFLGTKAESTARVREAMVLLQDAQSDGLDLGGINGLRASCDGLLQDAPSERAGRHIYVIVTTGIARFLSLVVWQWTHTGNLSTGQLNWTLAQVDTCSCSTRILHLLNSKWALAQLKMYT